jgi:hypothetical protein
MGGGRCAFIAKKQPKKQPFKTKKISNLMVSLLSLFRLTDLKLLKG